jgi:hypothetical protein
MEMFGIFFGYLDYIMAISYTLWPFGKLVAIWYIFPKNLATRLCIMSKLLFQRNGINISKKGTRRKRKKGKTFQKILI